MAEIKIQYATETTNEKGEKIAIDQYGNVIDKPLKDNDGNILDGYIARKYNYITDIGKLIDPLADKLTQMSLLLSLAILKILPWWIFAIVFIKECVMIVSASLMYKKEDVVVYSKWYGKLATVLFYLAIVCSLLINQFHFNISFRIDLYLYYLAILATIFSLVMYAIQFKFKKNCQ